MPPKKLRRGLITITRVVSVSLRMREGLKSHIALSCKSRSAGSEEMWATLMAILVPKDHVAVSAAAMAAVPATSPVARGR